MPSYSLLFVGVVATATLFGGYLLGAFVGTRYMDIPRQNVYNNVENNIDMAARARHDVDDAIGEPDDDRHALATPNPQQATTQGPADGSSVASGWNGAVCCVHATASCRACLDFDMLMPLHNASLVGKERVRFMASSKKACLEGRKANKRESDSRGLCIAKINLLVNAIELCQSQ